MKLLLGSFGFMLFVITFSKWKLTPALGWIMCSCYFILAVSQIYEDFAGAETTAALC